MMLVESAVRPHAIGTDRPRFSWQVTSTNRNVQQSAYRLMVASHLDLLTAGQPDLWDSGKVESNQSTHVRYQGKPLESNHDYVWTIQLWDQDGNSLPDYPIESFATSLFDSQDWTAKWIGKGDPDEPYPDPAMYQHETVTPEVEAFEPNPRSPMLRKTFNIDQPVRRARVFSCGLGLCVLRVNGEKVGDDQLSTPRTEFRKRALFNCYDITDQLREGSNVFGAILGNGWFNGQKSYWGWQMQWYGSPRLILQIELELEDGSTHRVVSDESWRGSWSPTVSSCLFDGETYDARLEQPGWDTAGFDDAGWDKVHIVKTPTEKLEPSPCDAERITDRIRPVAMTEPEPGVVVYDLGVNITGWVRLRVHDTKPGSEIVLRFGEAVHADGSLNNASQNRAKQTDTYICKGGDTETWEPSFTFHGFQFVEVRGAPSSIDLETVEGCFVRTAVAQTGNFQCSNELINKIHRCTLQSVLCNVQMGVPTDDTQRPERQGWGADAWAVANDALYNVDMSRVYEKWLGDFRDQQSDLGVVGMITPQAGYDEDLVWSAAFLLIPWWQYLHTGDPTILEQNYSAFRNYVSYLEKTGVREVEHWPTDQILAKLVQKAGEANRLPDADEHGYLQFSQWGDHLSLAEGYASRSNMPLSIATAFYFLDVMTMSQIASALGHEQDASSYRELAEKINTAYQERFHNEVRGYYDTGTQAAQAWPLAFDMVPESNQQAVEKHFVNMIRNTQRQLTTGYCGTRYAIEALGRAERHDVIWKLATATGYPSWAYMLRLNRTTSCERWDGEAGSLNHAPLGAAIDEWFYWGLAGIRPDAKNPGYENVMIKPYLPEDLQWVHASLQTQRGTIRSAWHQEHGEARVAITIPGNSTATVHLPCSDVEAITESDAPLDSLPSMQLEFSNDSHTIFQIGSGTYTFGFPIGH